MKLAIRETLKKSSLVIVVPRIALYVLCFLEPFVMMCIFLVLSIVACIVLIVLTYCGPKLFVPFWYDMAMFCLVHWLLSFLNGLFVPYRYVGFVVFIPIIGQIRTWYYKLD